MSAHPLSSRIACTRRSSANANCPGAFGRRGGRFGSSGAAAPSAVVMNGFDAALRQAITCSSPPSRTACRRFANAATGSSKNITPKRETIRSKRAGSNGYTCALAQMNSAGAPSRSARALATAISGSEMSTPCTVGRGFSRAWASRHGEGCCAGAASHVEHGAARFRGYRMDDQILERLVYLVEQFLVLDPGLPGRTVPHSRLLVVGVVNHIHRSLFCPRL